MSLPNEAKLLALKPKKGKKTADLLVCEGLSVHVRETRPGVFSRSYMFRYTLGGKVIKESLGSLNDVSLSQALMMCNERRRYVLQGQRPAKVIHEAIQRERARPLFSDAAKIYMSQRAGLEKTTLTALDQQLRAIVPLMTTDFEAPAIDKARNIILEYVSAQKYAKAQKIAALIKGIAETAIDAGFTDHNAFTRIKRLIPSHKVQHFRSADPDAPGEDVRMVLESVLTVGKVAENKKMYLLLGLFTLLRPSEVAALQIEDIDYTRGVLKCRHTKTLKDGWKIKLDPPLTALLQYITNKRKQGRLIPIISSRDCASCLNKVFRRRDLPMTCHGWRAAGAAWMVHNGISVEIADACLTHKIKSAVTAAYIRTDFPEERAAAMLKWHEFLVSVIQDIPEYKNIFSKY